MTNRTSSQITTDIWKDFIKRNRVDFAVHRAVQSPQLWLYEISVSKAVRRNGVIPLRVRSPFFALRTKFGIDLENALNAIQGVQATTIPINPHMVSIFIDGPDRLARSVPFREFPENAPRSFEGIPLDVIEVIEQVLDRNNSLVQRFTEWLRRI